MEANINTIHTYGKKCVGCVTHNKEVMVTYTIVEDRYSTKEFYDLFLSKDQAKKFLNDLKETIESNELDENKTFSDKIRQIVKEFLDPIIRALKG